MNRVNIIMAAYNGEKYIGEQIESIIKSNFKNWKLWIFDDGSTDRTSCIIEEYLHRYPDKIMYQKNTANKGVTLNFLEGVQFAAKSNNKIKEENTFALSDNMETEEIMEYYMFCDQDDVWMPDKINKTIQHMKKAEKKFGQDSVVAVFTDAFVVDEKLKVLYPSFYRRSKLDTRKVDLPHIMMENKMIGCTVMFNGPLQKKMYNHPQNARYHDWWTSLTAAAFGHISYLPQTTLFYRQHGGNVVGNRSFPAYVKKRLASLQKQKEIICKTALQAEEFYRIYHSQLDGTEKMQVYAMAYLLNQNWIKRRQLVFKYGFMKTGILRNLGLLFIL